MKVRTVTRGTWFRLNADGVAIAFLAEMRIFDIIDPDKSRYSVALGHVPQTFYLWTILYVLGGTVMMYGFMAKANHKISIELAGRYIIIQGLAIELWRSLSLFGFSTSAIQLLLLFIAIVSFFAMRATALLSKNGVTVVIGGPGKNKDR